MRIIDDEGLVLDSSPFRDRSLVLAVLTREHGLRRGVLHRARGGKRPRSAATQLLSLIHLNAHQRAETEMATFREVDLLRSSFGLSTNLQASSAAAVVAELLLSFCPLSEPAPRRFRLGVAALDHLLAGIDPDTVIGYVQQWILELSGLLPDLERCSACDQPGAEIIAWHSSSGQPLCAACGNQSQQGLSTRDLEFMARCRKTPLDELGGTIPEGSASWLDRLVRLEAERRLRALDFYRRHARADNV